MTVYTGYKNGWQYLCYCKHEDAPVLFSKFECGFTNSTDAKDNAYARKHKGTMLKRPFGFRSWQRA